MHDLISDAFFSILAAGFFVGVVVGLTGMGGGALMTPALIVLGVGDAATVVTADLTAAAIYKSGGAIVHKREGSPNMRLAMWLIVGSVPMALLGPHLVAWFTDPEDLDSVLKLCIGFALLLAAATYALRLYINLRRVRGGAPPGDEHPHIRPIPTLLVGALGGLLVGITSVGSGSVIMIALLMLYPGLAAVRLVGTDLVQAVPLVTLAVGALGGLLVGVTSVGSGSVIMIALLMLYPGLSAVKLVGTDLVQAVPLVLAAAISNIYLNGLDWTILIPLVLGSTPGTILG